MRWSEIPGYDYLHALLVWFVFIVIGWGMDRFLLPRLKKLALQWESPLQGVFIDSFQGKIVLLSFFIGLKFAFPYSPFSKEIISYGLLWSTVLLTVVWFIVLANVIVSSYRKLTFQENKHASSSIIENIVRIVLFCIAVLMILDEFGISITPILTALGVGALAVALALQDTLGNLFAGISVIAGKRIRPGHYIRLNSGEEGIIEDISWRSTMIRENNNNRIIVPNQKIATAIISNFDLSTEDLFLRIPIGVAYHSNLELVDSVCVQAALEVLENFYGKPSKILPTVRYRSFGESSIELITIVPMRHYNDQFALTDAFIRLVHLRFKENEIEIPYPIRTIIQK